MMNACLHVLRNGLLSLALLGTIGGSIGATAQSVASEDTVRSVQRMLERLPCRATFYRIYTDDFLSRYARGGVHQVLQELTDERHFPGMQPVGVYPIHIIVKNGRTMLLGVVDNQADRQIAEVRAREVAGVFEVENSLSLAGTEK